MKNEEDKFKVRHYKKYRSEDAKAGKRNGMCATFALSGIKRHARTPCSDALSYSWSAGQRHGISVSRPQLEVSGSAFIPCIIQKKAVTAD